MAEGIGAMQDAVAAAFASGRIVDAILALVVLEALALLAWRRRHGGPDLLGLMANLASGASLMLALRAALTGAPWTLPAVFLLAALAAHVLDITRRLRAGKARAGPG